MEAIPPSLPPPPPAAIPPSEGRHHPSTGREGGREGGVPRITIIHQWTREDMNHWDRSTAGRGLTSISNYVDSLSVIFHSCGLPATRPILLREWGAVYTSRRRANQWHSAHERVPTWIMRTQTGHGNMCIWHQVERIHHTNSVVNMATMASSHLPVGCDPSRRTCVVQEWLASAVLWTIDTCGRRRKEGRKEGSSPPSWRTDTGRPGGSTTFVTNEKILSELCRRTSYESYCYEWPDGAFCSNSGNRVDCRSGRPVRVQTSPLGDLSIGNWKKSDSLEVRCVSIKCDYTQKCFGKLYLVFLTSWIFEQRTI